MNFTEEQKKVFNFVKYDSNHGIIDAVAGSGKTTTIIESASYINSKNKILFCAFNRSIKKEIQNKFLEKNLSHIVVKTMHALGYDILKSNSKLKYEFDNNKYKKVIEEFVKANPENLINRILEINNIQSSPKDKIEKEQLKNFLFYLKFILNDINTKYRLTLTKGAIDDFRKLVIHFNIFGEIKTTSKNFEKELQLFFEANNYILNTGNELASKKQLVDYSDMLYLPYKEKLYPVNKFDLLFVDECQDLSNSQIAVALKYVKKEGRILSVGDPFQSIYGFAGADIESYNRLKGITNTIKLTLSKCFRCPNNVIELAQNFREDITPFKDKEGVIEKIDFESVIEKVAPGDLVISRLKSPLLDLLFQLLNKNIQVEVHEDDVKDILNSIRFIFTKEELKQKNIEPIIEDARQRNIYFIEKNALEIEDKDDRELHIASEVELLDSKLDLVKKQLSRHVEVENINELLKKIENLISGKKDAVKLSTIHRAKGLENSVIFILDFDTLPLYRDDQQEWERMQERNLKYVALTRTTRTLYLVNSKKFDLKENSTSLFDEIDWIE